METAKIILSYMSCILIGVLLTLQSIEAYCKTDKFITIFESGYHCSNDYTDIVFPKKDLNHDY